MSAFVNDLPTAIELHALLPAVYTAEFNGATLDLIGGEGQCFAVQQIGSFEEGHTWTGRIEQSADGSSWSAISGAAFAAVTEGDNLQSIRFTRSARYVRYAATNVGTGPEVVLAVLIGQAKKQF